MGLWLGGGGGSYKRQFTVIILKIDVWLIQTHARVASWSSIFFGPEKESIRELLGGNFRFENLMIFENARRVGDYLPSSSFLRRENYTPTSFSGV